MRGFIFGIATMILIIVAGVLVAMLGYVNMRADDPPSKMESAIAMRAMDASVERAAPKLKNPLDANEANLTAGARLYREHCTLCHGDPTHQKAPLAETLNPPAPQFMEDMADMPENENFYILQHGVRWTAMPGWKTVLSEEQMWQLVTFLSHMHELPPGAKGVFVEGAAETPSNTH
jgi:mono/diheme cytochrome c family protein